jgi:hypothetical protein
MHLRKVGDFCTSVCDALAVQPTGKSGVEGRAAFGKAVGALTACALGLSLLLPGCSARAKPVQVAATPNVTLDVALASLQQAINSQHAAGQMGDQEYRAWNGRLMPALALGRDITGRLAAWPAGGPVPAGLPALVEQIRPMVNDLASYAAAVNRQLSLKGPLDMIQANISGILKRISAGERAARAG